MISRKQFEKSNETRWQEGERLVAHLDERFAKTSVFLGSGFTGWLFLRG